MRAVSWVRGIVAIGALVLLGACGDDDGPSIDARAPDATPGPDARRACWQLADSWQRALTDVSDACARASDCLVVGITTDPDCDCNSQLGCDIVLNAADYQGSRAAAIEAEYASRCQDFINSCDCAPAHAQCIDMACQGVFEFDCF